MIQTSTNQLTNQQFYDRIVSKPNVKERIENCEILKYMYIDSIANCSSTPKGIPLRIDLMGLEGRLNEASTYYSSTFDIPRTDLKNVIYQITDLRNEDFPENISTLYYNLESKYENLDILPF